MRWWLDRLAHWQAHEPDFMTLRQVAGITCKEVATLCGVKEATVRHWEAGKKPPPRAIVLLLHLSGGQLGVLDPAWRDWHIRAGQLWAPHLLGRGFTPEHLKVYEYTFRERDQLRRDLETRTAQRSQDSQKSRRETLAGVTIPAAPITAPRRCSQDDPSHAGSIPDRAQASGNREATISGSSSRIGTRRPNLTTAAPAAPSPDHSRACGAADLWPVRDRPDGASGCGQPRLRAVDSLGRKAGKRRQERQERHDGEDSGARIVVDLIAGQMPGGQGHERGLLGPGIDHGRETLAGGVIDQQRRPCPARTEHAEHFQQLDVAGLQGAADDLREIGKAGLQAGQIGIQAAQLGNRCVSQFHGAPGTSDDASTLHAPQGRPDGAHGKTTTDTGADAADTPEGRRDDGTQRQEDPDANQSTTATDNSGTRTALTMSGQDTQPPEKPLTHSSVPQALRTCGTEEEVNEGYTLCAI